MNYTLGGFVLGFSLPGRCCLARTWPGSFSKNTLSPAFARKELWLSTPCLLCCWARGSLYSVWRKKAITQPLMAARWRRSRKHRFMLHILLDFSASITIEHFATFPRTTLPQRQPPGEVGCLSVRWLDVFLNTHQSGMWWPRWPEGSLCVTSAALRGDLQLCNTSRLITISLFINSTVKGVLAYCWVEIKQMLLN